MDPLYINKEKIAELLPMNECIAVMEKAFRSLADGECAQPLRSLMWLPNKSGLLGMMPGHAGSLGVMGIKIVSVFHGNKAAGIPSHQGVVVLFESKHGQPILILDATEITAIRTAAVSALATRLLSRENSETLAIIGTGEQAERHIEAIMLVRKIKQVNLWGRNEKNANKLAQKMQDKFNIPINVKKDVPKTVQTADIICTVTAATQPVVKGEWISNGTHINAVGACTVNARELDTAAMLKSNLFTDCYESLFNEAGDFLIPKKEGAVNDNHVKGELGEVLLGTKKGRENKEEITLFKSLGVAAQDLFSAWHIYQKINQQ
jgi:alanine dehydrogenase